MNSNPRSLKSIFHRSSLAAAVALSFTLAHADMLELKTGKGLNRTYVGGTAATVRVETFQLVALTPFGAKPGGVIASTRQLIAEVTSLDVAKHQATLQFADGNTKTVTFRPDLDLAQRKVGKQVVIRLTESLALRMQRP